MDASMDIIVWDCLWHRQYPSPSSIVISAVTGHIAWFRDGDRTVNVLAVNVKGMAVGAPQGLRHPRETAWIGWRRSTATNSDPFLYTITTNSVLRIYSPVLDDPSWFQLLLTLDSKSFAPPPVRLSGKGKAFVPPAMQGQIWPLDAEIIRAEAILELETLGNQASGAAAQIRKILESLAAEECDVFVWLGDDGSVALRSVIVSIAPMSPRMPLIASLHRTWIANRPHFSNPSLFLAHRRLRLSRTSLPHLAF